MQIEINFYYHVIVFHHAERRAATSFSISRQRLGHSSTRKSFSLPPIDAFPCCLRKWFDFCLCSLVPAGCSFLFSIFCFICFLHSCQFQPEFLPPLSWPNIVQLYYIGLGNFLLLWQKPTTTWQWVRICLLSSKANEESERYFYVWEGK